MRSMYYDRSGEPIDWRDATKIDKRVALDTLTDGKVVSTVWLGLDHAFNGGPPLIFETMVFPNADDFGNIDSDRYSTEAEAVAGHAAMVAKWAAACA